MEADGGCEGGVFGDDLIQEVIRGNDLIRGFFSCLKCHSTCFGVRETKKARETRF